MAVKGIRKKYKCPYPSCKDKPEFEKIVVYDAGKHSTQIVCPYCTNLIPTWKKESTGKMVGKKHIHIR